MQTANNADWRSTFIARHRRVLLAYQEVLDNGSIPAAELDAIIERMRRAAQEIRAVEDASTNSAVAA